ncbi:hypothetical protein CBS101457_001602 [Exobasidium rhododendri]|nr:hypothetical protein CBS101457_001602 [Exobasidium rhododendri]
MQNAYHENLKGRYQQRHPGQSAVSSSSLRHYDGKVGAQAVTDSLTPSRSLAAHAPDANMLIESSGQGHRSADLRGQRNPLPAPVKDSSPQTQFKYNEAVLASRRIMEGRRLLKDQAAPSSATPNKPAGLPRASSGDGKPSASADAVQQQSNLPMASPAASTKKTQFWQFDDSATLFRRLLPEDFRSYPRFVPGQVDHYSRRYSNMGRLSAEAPKRPFSSDPRENHYERLKVHIDPTPPADVLREASAGIGRLVGLLPATDLLDREASTLQASISTLMNMMESANERAMLAERRLDQKEMEIKCLQEEVNVAKTQLNTLTLGVGATSGGIVPFGKSLDTIHQYFVEANKRDKWLGEKLASYDRAFGVLEKILKSGSGETTKEQASHSIDAESAQIPAAVHAGSFIGKTSEIASQGSFLAATGQAAQAVLGQIGEARSGRDGVPLESTEGEAKAALPPNSARDLSKEKPVNNSSQTDMVTKDLEREEEVSSDPQTSTLHNIRNDRTRAIPMTVAAEQRSGESDAVAAEGRALEEARTNLGVKVEEERDGLDSVGTSHRERDTQSTSAHDKQLAAEAGETAFRSPSTVSVPYDGRKRRREHDITSFTRKGRQFESIVISDEESD